MSNQIPVDVQSFPVFKVPYLNSLFLWKAVFNKIFEFYSGPSLVGLFCMVSTPYRSST